MFDIKVSIADEMVKTISINVQNIVCLIISNFMFSFLLSFIIDLYNLNPLTLIASIAGINIKFCNNKLLNTKASPLEVPKIPTHADIVYPKQNPRYTTNPNTTGIPYYCCSKKP